MPEFTTMSVQEAQLRTPAGRQGRYLNEYIDYIQRVPSGQAGKLTIGEQEKYPTVRRRLVVAANALAITLIIKRSGNDLYFWREDREEEQPKRKRRYTRRMRSHDEIPPRISQLTNWEWLSKEYQRENPRNQDKSQGNRG
jgi:hypothetical protein